MAQRLKGQDVVMSVISDGVLLTRIDTISSATVEVDLELLEESYLGRTSDDFDSVYNGVRVELSGHMTSQEVIDFAEAVTNRARNRAGAATRIDISGTFIFPNGETPSMVIPDVYFEAIPFEIGGRKEYVQFTLSGKAGDWRKVV